MNAHAILRIFESEDESPIMDFILEESERECPKEREALQILFDSSPKGDPQSKYITLGDEIMALAFSCGYVFGQELGVADAETRKEVEELKQILINKGLLKYVSKGKPSGLNESQGKDILTLLREVGDETEKVTAILSTVGGALTSEADNIEEIGATLSIAEGFNDTALEKVFTAINMVRPVSET